MNNKKRWAAKVFGGLLALSMLVGGFALAVPTTVQAANAGQEPTPPTTGGLTAQNPQRIEQVYQRETKTLDAQVRRLEKTADVIVRFEARIDELKAKGLDTSALAAALADYQNSVGAAQAFHDEAAAILSAHAGFDGSGKVTDARLALDTVQDAGKALKDAHQELRPAIRDLLQALREFRRDNRARP